jgi:hypothetical protein
MKLARMLVVCLAVSAAPAALAQKWEIGGGGGFGFHTSNDIDRTTESASAKITPGAAASAWITNNGNARWGGEIRYTYQMGKLKLEQASTKAEFDAETHAIGYDFQWHTRDAGAPARGYIAFGGGVKVYRGTGTETLTQPLSRFALLTQTQELQGMISVGAGIKTRMGKNWQLRLDVHDYITRFPKEVIQPNAGASVGGWINDIVPTIGISWTR